MPLPSSVRVVQYNVRRFVDAATQSSTLDAIAASLKALRPDLVSLNEVDLRQNEDCLYELARKITDDSTAAEAPAPGYDVSFWGHVREKYGNALLSSKSKFAVGKIEKHHVPGGSCFSFPAGTKKFNGEIAKEGETHRIARGMLEVWLKVLGGGTCGEGVPGGEYAVADTGDEADLRVFVTHLDHISEAERCTQLQYLQEQIWSERGGGSPCLLLGDLNSLTREDYTDDEWRALEERHAEKGWNPPQSGCSDMIKKSAPAWDHGESIMVDAFELFHTTVETKSGCVPAVHKLGKEDKFSAHVGQPLYRIDYVFANMEFLRYHDVSDAKVLKDIALSDHYPLCVDFAEDPGSSAESGPGAAKNGGAAEKSSRL
eukprot:g532.t1